MGCSASAPSEGKGERQQPPIPSDCRDSMPTPGSNTSDGASRTTKKSSTDLSVSSCGESTNTMDGSGGSVRTKKKQFRSLLDDPQLLSIVDDNGVPFNKVESPQRTGRNYSTGSNCTVSPAKVSLDLCASRSNSQFAEDSFKEYDEEDNTLQGKELTAVKDTHDEDSSCAFPPVQEESTNPFIGLPQLNATAKSEDLVDTVPSIDVTPTTGASTSSGSGCGSPLLPLDTLIEPFALPPKAAVGVESDTDGDAVELFPIVRPPRSSKQPSVSGGSFDHDFGEMFQSHENNNSLGFGVCAISFDEASASLSARKRDSHYGPLPERPQQSRRVSFQLTVDSQLNCSHSSNLATPRQPRQTSPHPCSLPADLTRGI